ncbi:phage tail protein, partial [Salmonella enterica subsp. enterica]|nr:phage tail protein [Salmonella enterica subsp. enterica]
MSQSENLFDAALSQADDTIRR